jgi:lysozyme family protein
MKSRCEKSRRLFLFSEEPAMASFSPAFNHTVGIEGGYANDPDDHGGETFCGVARKHHPNWPGWKIIDTYTHDDRRKLTLESSEQLSEAVKEFYQHEFWNPLNLDAVDRQILAAEVFDTAVNCGNGKAGEILQSSLNIVGGFSGRNLSCDGIIGPKTIEVLNACKYPLALLKCLNGFQFEHYHKIVMNNPSQSKWFRGWLRRVWEYSGNEFDGLSHIGLT